MTYRVELAASAKADIREQGRSLRGRFNPAAADKWPAGLNKALASPSNRPLHCPLAVEGDKFPPADPRILLRPTPRESISRPLRDQEDVVLVIFVRHAPATKSSLDRSSLEVKQASRDPAIPRRWVTTQPTRLEVADPVRFSGETGPVGLDVLHLGNPVSRHHRRWARFDRRFHQLS